MSTNRAGLDNLTQRSLLEEQMAKLLAGALIFAFMAVPYVQAQNCNNSQFKGVYSALAQGEFIAGLPAPLAGPTTRIGRVEADGKGNSSIRAITSLNGIVITEEYQGTYTVNPDCTSRVILNIPFPGLGIIPFTFNGIISDHFQQYDIFLVDPPGSTVGISLRQQNRGACSASDLRGGYAVSMRGVTNLPLGPAVPFARLGRIVFDGKGAFTAETTVSNGGAIAADNFNGTYSVNGLCEMTMSFGAGNTWSGVLKDNSSGANLMVTGPTVLFNGFPLLGSVISGTLTGQ
jgi:hypothetical protein